MGKYKFDINNITVQGCQNLGTAIIMQACSNALFVLARSPIYRRHTRYYSSVEDAEFIKSKEFVEICNIYRLDINPEVFREDFFEYADKLLQKYITRRENDTSV